MTETAQPNASQMPSSLLEAVLQSISTEPGAPPADIIHRDQHSNDFAEMRFRNGRSLIVKRGRYEWAESRFQTSRIASGLIRERTEVAVPAPLPVPADLDEKPLEAYWRIDRPTLQEIWGSLTARQRRGALISWGKMISRLHEVRLEGFGPLSDPATANRSLGGYLRQELEDRLLPAVTGEWPAGLPALQRLVRLVDEIGGVAGDRSRLVHNDMHMGNVLCEHRDGEVRCVGMIDLETAVAAPPEADLAIMQIHHGALFDQPIEGEWFADVMQGYSGALNERSVAFFRAYHLINLGFYSALIGHDWHADQVAADVMRETAALERRRFRAAGRETDARPPLVAQRG
jgi:aminoglycoside phosphotransferase (APT) family kinase protein